MGFGLRLRGKDIAPLGRQVASAIQKALDLTHVRPTKDDRRGYQLLYFTTPGGLSVPGESGRIPCLPIDTNPNTWLVVELRMSPGDERAGEHYIEHISIKTYFGSVEDAALIFRAEWDPRDDEHKHAQPHWNVHELPLAEPEIPGFESFLDQEAGFSSTSRRDLTARLDRVGIHFALASTWHMKPGSNSCALENLEQIARWVGGCCAYLRTELASLA